MGSSGFYPLLTGFVENKPNIEPLTLAVVKFYLSAQLAAKVVKLNNAEWFALDAPAILTASTRKRGRKRLQHVGPSRLHGDGA